MPKKAAASTKKTGKKKKTAKKKAAAKPVAAKAAKKKPAAESKPAAAKSAGTGRLRVRQVRSGIGHADTYRRTLRALGLKHHQDETVIADNPSARGMLRKVGHLVRVTPEEA